MAKAIAHDPEYVQGQIFALKALILALADSCAQRGEFVSSALHHLEMTRTALLDSPAGDARLVAIDHFQAWLEKLSE